MTRLLIVLAIFSATLSAQPKQMLILKGDTCRYSHYAATTLYFGLWEVDRPETTALVYIKQGFFFRGPDSIEYQFTVDSIRGRGDKRDALVSMARKTTDSTRWLWTVERWGASKPSPDGIGMTADVFTDTLGRTLDSTVKESWWFSYSRRMMDPTTGYWYIYSDTSHPAMGQTFRWHQYPWDWVMNMRMEKILGDPTKNFGWDQRAMLKVAYFQMPSDSLRKQIDAGTWR